jgi:hypothetical protein
MKAIIPDDVSMRLVTDPHDVGAIAVSWQNTVDTSFVAKLKEKKFRVCGEDLGQLAALRL